SAFGGDQRLRTPVCAPLPAAVRAAARKHRHRGAQSGEHHRRFEPVRPGPDGAAGFRRLPLRQPRRARLRHRPGVRPDGPVLAGRTAAGRAGAAGRRARGRRVHHLPGHRLRCARGPQPGHAVRRRVPSRHRRRDRRGRDPDRGHRAADRRAAGAPGAPGDAVDPAAAGTGGGEPGVNQNPFVEALSWLSETTRWSGPSGIPMRTLEHLGYTALGVAIAAVIAIPLGLLVGHTGRGKGIAVASAGAARALPTLGLVTLFALLLGLGLTAPLLAFVVLAIPSLLAGAYSAVESA